MRCVTATVLNIFLASLAPVFAQDTSDVKSANRSECAVVGANQGNKPEDFRFRMGGSLQIKATGDLVKKIETEWGKTKSLKLYFDGENIADLQSPPQRVEAGKELLLDFALVRDAENDVNRQAWDRLFKKQHGYLMTIQLSVGIGNDLPLVVQSFQPFQFYVASGSAILLTLVSALVSLLVSYYCLVKRTKMLYDAGTTCYSLGKSQMAFWGLLVLFSFAGVWILTGTMERIPPQALILLGISGATGLSAVVIGNNKRAETKTKLAQLQQEKQNLKEQEVNSSTAFPQASKDRLAAIEPDISELSKQLDAGASKGFWRDICNDGNGASFHRLQVVIWTLVLGATFIQAVAKMMSMPEFSETLLSLLGISNATYIGFKIPEKS
jgi:hypothetical protein